MKTAFFVVLAIVVLAVPMSALAGSIETKKFGLSVNFGQGKAETKVGFFDDNQPGGTWIFSRKHDGWMFFAEPKPTGRRAPRGFSMAYKPKRAISQRDLSSFFSDMENDRLLCWGCDYKTALEQAIGREFETVAEMMRYLRTLPIRSVEKSTWSVLGWASFNPKSGGYDVQLDAARDLLPGELVLFDEQLGKPVLSLACGNVILRIEEEKAAPAPASVVRSERIAPAPAPPAVVYLPEPVQDEPIRRWSPPPAPVQQETRVVREAPISYPVYVPEKEHSHAKFYWMGAGAVVVIATVAIYALSREEGDTNITHNTTTTTTTTTTNGGGKDDPDDPDDPEHPKEPE